MAGLLLLLLFAVATLGVLRLPLDLSFRPLFASSDEQTAATREFESVFGQSSGAWITAIVEKNGLAPSEFLAVIVSMSESVRNIDHVVEVSSLTAARFPVWNQGDLTLSSAIPEQLFEVGNAHQLNSHWETLLDDSRFVNRLVSPDGSRLLIGARLDLELEDLEGRRTVIEQFKHRIESLAVAGTELYFTGVSVVELAYERQILRDQLLATGLTLFIITVFIYCAFKRITAVVICLVPVALAIPATLGMMGWLGQSVSIINTAIPAVVLVVGVGDGVHMLSSYLESRDSGQGRRSAIVTMLALTSAACFFTTITTMGGFLSLLAADLDAVGSFGLSAAIGILFAWLANRLILPALLQRLEAGDKFESNFATVIASNLVSSCIGFAQHHPRRVIGAALFGATCCLAVIPSLQVDQFFNKELPPSSSVSIAQQIFETDFEGFLGPEISIRHKDGSGLLDDLTLQKLEQFVTALAALPETNSVRSLIDLLPEQLAASERSAVITQMRNSSELFSRVQELINEKENHLAVILRIDDIGTERAEHYRASISQLSEELWGTEYAVEIVGQWWLAQQGMQQLLNDMLISFFTAMLIVLPIMYLVLRNRRLFIAAAAANLLPLLIPLAYMAVSGTALRIGTVVVLAIIIGIAVDNTFHLVIRVGNRELANNDQPTAMSLSLEGSARAVVFTSFILAAGFLSMATNELLAIRDMGIVASIAILATMFADLLILPAVYSILQKSPGRKLQQA